MNEQFPSAQGLYDPQHEHDSCGVGFVVDLKGRKSHSIVANGLEVLSNLQHRGASGCEKNTGDGAGILMQVPHRFFADVCGERGIKLPAAGQYGVGVVFLPNDPGSRAACEHLFEKVVHDEGQTFLGWREVPTDNSMIGPSAQRSQPVIQQVFIGRDPRRSVKDDDAFERKLYVIRRRARHEVRRLDVPEKANFYIPSLSARTVVYKGMLSPDQLPAFFPDLQRRPGGVGAGAGALALLDQHLPQLGARASLPPGRAQRRDQHAARQRQLDARAREHVRVASCSATTWRSASRSSTPTAATRRCSTTCSSCWCSRGGRCRTR